MEPYDLEHVVEEEMRFIGLSGGVGRDDAAAEIADVECEIEQAVDAVCQRHAYAEYDLLMSPEYMLDPHESPDEMILILSWSMPGPF